MSTGIDCYIDPNDVNCAANEYKVITASEVSGGPDEVDCRQCGGNCESCRD